MSEPLPMFLTSAKLALAIRRIRAERPDSSLLASDPIAIVGIGCRFPGGVRSAEDYWQLLHGGVDAITSIPPERWDADAYFDEDPQASGKMNTRYGGFVPQAEFFDPLFFGISPREATSMDPQHRLLLEVAWEAIWNSGRSPESLAGNPVGVFIAEYLADYARLLVEDIQAIGPHTTAGGSHSIASGRISFLLDLHGPSISVDTACSSSLVAAHVACQSLRAGDCNMALAGGVSLHLLPEHYVALAKLGMLAPDGRCKTFDSRANGFVPGEGCGVVVLKLLAEALKDGDHVYAVIRGTAVNEDGRTNVMTAPNGLAQQELIRSALRNAQVPPSNISYVEAHGTGTALGDPIEVEALTEVLGADTANAVPCALGAVKSNIGHLEASAGIAGLIKAALALDREEIPPNLHYSELNPHITLQKTRFFIPTRPTAWPRGPVARFAGTSAFGFGGTNAHVVLEEAPFVPRRPDSKQPLPERFLLPISARTPEALRDFAALYREFLHSEPGQKSALYDICHSAATRRHHYEERLALLGSSPSEISRLVGEFLDGHSARGASSGRASREGEGVVFLCSGQGSQWAGMGTGLFKSEPIFRTTIEECDELVRQYAGWSLIDQLSACEEFSQLQNTEFAQPALFAIEVALARLWQFWGVRPSAIIGHSAGEVAAAHIAGVLDLKEAIRVVVHRGRLMQAATGLGAMAAIHLPVSAVEEELREFGEQVSIAAVNSPESVVISGATDIVKRLIAHWLGKGVGCRMLPVNYAFHSAQMDPFSKQLALTLGKVTRHPQTVPLISTVYGATAEGVQFDEDYWAQNVRKPVLFAKAVAAAVQMGLATFLEIGPHPVLLSSVGECLGAGSRREYLIPSLSRNQDEMDAVLSSLGKLFAVGCPVEWNSVYATRASPVSLPTYPYQRQRYWIGRRTKKSANALHPLLGSRLRSPALRGAAFEAELNILDLPYLADHCIDGAILLPMTAFLEIANAAVSIAVGESRALIDITVLSPLIFPEGGSCTIQAVVEPDRVQVFSQDGDDWKLHASGKVAMQSDDRDLQFLPKPSTGCESIDPHAFYKRLRENRAEFGESFCVLQSLHAKAGEALGRVCLRNREKRGAARYRIHPALLDGCFQTAIAAVPEDLAGTYLPFGIDRFETFASAGASAWARVCVNKFSADRETLSTNIDVLSDEGRLLARVQGLHFKRRSSRSSAGQKIYQVQWHRAAREIESAATTGNWLIVSDNAGEGRKIVEVLEKRSCRAIMSTPGERFSFAKTIQGVVYLSTGIGGKNSIGEQLDETASVLKLTQELLQHSSARPPRLILVTRGAMSVTPLDRDDGLFEAPVWGIGRTIAIEHPELSCMRIDLDPEAIDFVALAEEISGQTTEEEVAFRGDERYVPRLEPKPVREIAPRQLTVSARGSLENLTFVPLERRPPFAGDVEVEVETTGLNFRDVLNALGTYSGDPGPLGLEFCGRIARVGPGVASYKPGDRVMGIAWASFASYVNTPAALVAPVPTGLNAAEAVSIPNAFLTAYHCLVELGGIKPGNRVLIHAATGGVGLAAVQVAQQAGAEIFATAGSEHKREYLRSLGVQHVLSSRTLDFARDISVITGGKGVDLVLNSLAGDFIDAGFAVLAEGGRFIEIGKSGIWGDQQVAALGKSVRYDVVDLAPVINSDPERIRKYLTAICNSIAAGALRPLPTCIFEFDDAAIAFRHMAQAKHIGKIVLRHPLPFRVSPEAAYMVTGGLGAIGLLTAEWMVEQGARNLLLLGRSEPRPEILARIETLRKGGARIEIRAADVADRAQMESLCDELQKSMPPLRGVIHCAGIVDDGVLAQQTPERFAKVMAPKVAGAWNLHELTRLMPLDFFVLCSSVASVTGSPSQSAYAAGNAFLDALAHFRRSRGLPALSINWGAWAEGGMAARVEAEGRRRVLSGIRPMTSSDCFECFAAAVSAGSSQLAIADIDWSQWKNPPKLLSGLINKVSVADARQPENGILDSLENAPASNRRNILMDYLREEALGVLGLSQSHFIDERQPLLKMGLDSLMAVEFRNRLAASLHRSLTATLLFDYPTIGGLADYLNAQTAPVQATAVDQLLGSVDSLTDAEAEELLKEELGHTS